MSGAFVVETDKGYQLIFSWDSPRVPDPRVYRTRALAQRAADRINDRECVRANNRYNSQCSSMCGETD